MSFFVFGSLGACERLARRAESQVEGSNGCMREDYADEHCESELTQVQGDHSPWRKPPIDIDLKLRFNTRSLY